MYENNKLYLDKICHHVLTSFEECDTDATTVLSSTSLNSSGTCTWNN